MKRNFNSLEDVEKTFKSWDLNADGAISFTELQVFQLFMSEPKSLKEVGIQYWT